MKLVEGEVDITGVNNLHEAGAYVEIYVFDDDGHEGFGQTKYFKSSWLAAKWFTSTFDDKHHCTIIQTDPDQ